MRSPGAAEQAARHLAHLEAERQRAEAERRQREDEKQASELLALLERWRLAREIRQYASEARALVADAKLHILRGSWLDRDLVWADIYADRIDPLSRVRKDISGSLANQVGPPVEEPRTSQD